MSPESDSHAAPGGRHTGSGPVVGGSSTGSWPGPSDSQSGPLASPPLHEPGSALAASPAQAAPSRARRATFGAGELAMVCSRYDVGVIEAVSEFRRGSGRAPKVVLKT